MTESRPSTGPQRLFLNLPEMRAAQRRAVPPVAWRAVRWAIVAVTVAFVVSCFRWPQVGLRVFWGVYVPLAPALFLTEPGLWRNICPLASFNQIPRTLGFTRSRTLPRAVARYAPLVSAGLFLVLVALRPVVLQSSGPALGIMLIMLLALAFLGGAIFKGKSGWCTQFCPMLQVERFYGQAPLRVVPNSHCRPCVGCSSNCHDFNPTAAYLADLHDDDPKLGANRRIFAGLMPWLVFAFFTQPVVAPFTWEAAGLAGRLLLFAAAGVGLFVLLEQATRFSAQHLALLHAAAAFNLFYLFVVPIALGPVGQLPAVRVAVGAAVLALTAAWLVRAWPRERAFVGLDTAAAKVADQVLSVHSAQRAAAVEILFTDGPTVLVKPGTTLLEAAEGNGVAIASGCRMGVCGADPVQVLDGADHLSPAGAGERATLERLGLAGNCRMACMAKAVGDVRVSTSVDGAQEAEVAAVAFAPTAGADRLVVLGGGAAGVTAGTELRRLHPDAEITVIGFEPYDFYNRMAIGKLMSESTSIRQLYLLAEDWPAAKRIRALRGVSAVRIDLDAREVTTDEDERIGYDRLIIATGARAAVPPIEGFGLPGTFTLRTIDDAVQIQQHVRGHRARRAVVVGGGLLGLEAAYEMVELGLRVTVLDRGAWPLGRQLDEAAGRLVATMLGDLGIELSSGCSARAVHGNGRLEAVQTTDGQVLPADLCLVAAGIAPDVQLAREAGLQVARGIVVDDRMQTSDPSVFAVGDVIDHDGRRYGLWPAAVDQARVAAVNALGGAEHFLTAVPPTRLKIAAIRLLSVGSLRQPPDDHGDVLAVADPSARRYRMLVLARGRAVGGVLIGHPEWEDALLDAVESGRDVSAAVGALRSGDWSALDGVADAPKVAPDREQAQPAAR